VELGEVLRRLLLQAKGAEEFHIVVPRELLAQRYRTQRTFSVAVGSVAALALLVGGVGSMNIVLTSGVERTAGAKRRDVTMQFLIETLLMTVGGGVAASSSARSCRSGSRPTRAGRPTCRSPRCCSDSSYRSWWGSSSACIRR